MKNLFILVCAVLCLTACKSDEEKANETIKESMFKTAYDFDSYQPIETEITQTRNDIFSDIECVKWAKFVLEEKEKAQKENSERIMDEYYNSVEYFVYSNFKDIVERLETLNPDSLTKSKTVLHKYRMKNRGGIYNIFLTKYILSEDLRTILFQYDLPTDEEDENNVSYVLSKANLCYRSKIRGEQFLLDKEKQSDVKKTESGLLYRIISKGNGENVDFDKAVKFKYVSTNVEGDVLVDSRQSGRSFLTCYTSQTIPGFSEGMKLMQKGDVYEFYVPSHLAYGSKAMKDYPPYSTLVFHIELLGN